MQTSLLRTKTGWMVGWKGGLFTISVSHTKSDPFNAIQWILPKLYIFIYVESQRKEFIKPGESMGEWEFMSLLCDKSIYEFVNLWIRWLWYVTRIHSRNLWWQMEFICLMWCDVMYWAVDGNWGRGYGRVYMMHIPIFHFPFSILHPPSSILHPPSFTSRPPIFPFNFFPLTSTDMHTTICIHIHLPTST